MSFEMASRTGLWAVLGISFAGAQQASWSEQNIPSAEELHEALTDRVPTDK